MPYLWLTLCYNMSMCKLAIEGLACCIIALYSVTVIFV